MGNFLAEYPRRVRSFVLCLCVYFCSAVGAQAQHMHVASRSAPPAHTLGYSDYTGIITRVCYYKNLLWMLVCDLYEAVCMLYPVTIEIFGKNAQRNEGLSESCKKISVDVIIFKIF